MIISLGLQCANADFRKIIDKDNARFPFDWMFAIPDFVYEMLYLLFEKELNIEELVREHFFNCNEKAYLTDLENYNIDNTGYAYYNSIYNVIFPHESKDKEKEITKYIRRFERLKDTILNSKEKIYFIYTSQSSLEKGNFTINNKKVINNVYLNLSKIYELISKYNNNFRFIVFDSIKEEDKNLLNKNITLYELHAANNYKEIIKQMINYKNIFN